MIDTSKIRPGDTGTIRVTFADRASGGDVQVCLGPRCIYVPASIIASHTPAPWVPEPGDVVAWSRAGGEWTVCGIDNNAVWIKYITPSYAIAKLSDLTLIRKGAACKADVAAIRAAQIDAAEWMREEAARVVETGKGWGTMFPLTPAPCTDAAAKAIRSIKLPGDGE